MRRWLDDSGTAVYSCPRAEQSRQLDCGIEPTDALTVEQEILCRFRPTKSVCIHLRQSGEVFLHVHLVLGKAISRCSMSKYTTCARTHTASDVANTGYSIASTVPHDVSVKDVPHSALETREICSGSCQPVRKVARTTHENLLTAAISTL